ncbi:hypothetical protein GCM10009733_101520 [Nonomuraea maheshkhaliensis]|uniref:ATP-binding protein n=1 Tax=Nonomuraea maheshkhaliensis TaxID=419590 RepID=A0ABN2HIU3_9ACTN
MRPYQAATRRQLPTSPFKVPDVPPPPIEQFVTGDQVSHDKYGLGRVIAVHQDVAVIVDFGSETYRLTAPYAKLEKL